MIILTQKKKYKKIFDNGVNFVSTKVNDRFSNEDNSYFKKKISKTSISENFVNRIRCSLCNSILNNNKTFCYDCKKKFYQIIIKMILKTIFIRKKKLGKNIVTPEKNTIPNDFKNNNHNKFNPYSNTKFGLYKNIKICLDCNVNIDNKH